MNTTGDSLLAQLNGLKLDNTLNNNNQNNTQNQNNVFNNALNNTNNNTAPNPNSGFGNMNQNPYGAQNISPVQGNFGGLNNLNNNNGIGGNPFNGGGAGLMSFDQRIAELKKLGA